MPVEVIDFVWLGIAILAAVVEAVVPSLVSVWFVPGSLAGLIVSLCGGPIWLQIFVFLAVSLACLAFTRPLAKKLLVHHKERTTQKDGKIEAGSRVHIERIEGVKLLVTPVEPPQP